MKLALLQSAIRSITDLRIVETLDEFQNTTHGHGSSTSLTYQEYYDLLIKACVRYNKTKKVNIGKRTNVYNSTIDSTYVDYPPDVSDFVPDSPFEGIYLPSDEFYHIHALSFRLYLLSGLATPLSHHSGPISTIRTPKILQKV